jgi:hypothetical protein
MSELSPKCGPQRTLECLLAANIDGGMRQSVTYLQRLMMKIGKYHQLARPSFSGNRPRRCHYYFRRFSSGLEGRIFSSATGNAASHFKKPFQSFCRLAPAVSVFERLGPSTFLPRILWAR